MAAKKKRSSKCVTKKIGKSVLKVCAIKSPKQARKLARAFDAAMKAAKKSKGVIIGKF